MFAIEKNVAIPATSGKGAPSKYPFRQMEAGDSFLVPVEKDARTSSKLSNAASSFARDNGGKFVTRWDGDGYRVWCIEPAGRAKPLLKAVK